MRLEKAEKMRAFMDKVAPYITFYNDMNDEEIDEILSIANEMIKEYEVDWWYPLKDNPPKLGVPLIVTVKDYIYGGKRKILYPVYYMQDTFTGEWGFYLSHFENKLLPDLSEVVAWQVLPNVYSEECDD